MLLSLPPRPLREGKEADAIGLRGQTAAKIDSDTQSVKTQMAQ